MQREKRRNSILWVEAGGFSLIIAMSWLAELLRIPHYLFGESFVPNWHRAILRTLVIGAIWLWVYWITRRLLRRLHYLEDFLRICSWCRKVCHDDEWLGLEAFFDTKFATRTSHGMCPECLKKKVLELTLDEKPSKPQNRLN
jgi:hypothetical protein